MTLFWVIILNRDKEIMLDRTLASWFQVYMITCPVTWPSSGWGSYALCWSGIHKQQRFFFPFCLVDPGSSPTRHSQSQPLQISPFICSSVPVLLPLMVSPWGWSLASHRRWQIKRVLQQLWGTWATLGRWVTQSLTFSSSFSAKRQRLKLWPETSCTPLSLLTVSSYQDNHPLRRSSHPSGRGEP